MEALPDAVDAGGRSNLCRSLCETVSLQDVVGKSEQVQNGLNLETTAYHELTQVPLPESGVDAFAHGTPVVDGLADRFLHASAPGGNTGTIVLARRIGIGVVLAADWRAIDFHTDAGGPFGIVIFVEATVDEIAFRPAAIAPFDLREHRRHQATIRAGGRGFEGDDDLAFCHGG